MRRTQTFIVFMLAWSVASSVAAQVLDWPTERPPRPLPARDITFPPYQIRTLPNGLQWSRCPTLASRRVAQLIRGPAVRRSPVTRPGVAYVAAALLDQAPRQRPRSRLHND